MEKKGTTLYEETNNPLNIRFSPANHWRGQIGQVRGFCQFSTVGFGFRAGYVLLNTYIRNGYNTIETIIRRWAPPTENDTENYVMFVSKRTGIRRDKVLTTANIDGYFEIMAIISAMAKMEVGINVEPQTINLSINNPSKY